MKLHDKIALDFKVYTDFLSSGKIPPRVPFHRRRASAIGALMFLADIAANNNMPKLFNQLLEKAKFVKKPIEEISHVSWIHNMRDISKMDITFLCEMAKGYNTTREQYNSKFNDTINMPNKFNAKTCPTSPAIKKSINQLITKIVEKH